MKRSFQTIMIVALVLIAAFVIGSYYRTIHAPLPEVVLPQLPQGGAEQTADPQGDVFNNAARIPVTVTPDTVQSVIATLERPKSYDRMIEVITYWGDSHAASVAQVWVDSGFKMTSLTPESGSTMYTLTDDETYYQWYQNDLNYYESAADDKSTDLGQRIPTYEDILEVDSSHISAASYVEWGGLSCVYTEVYVEEHRQTERYWVSVPTGLLVHSETEKDGKILYEMSSYSVNQPVANGVTFSLPDGTVLHRTST